MIPPQTCYFAVKSRDGLCTMVLSNRKGQYGLKELQEKR
jgi:hypothetical protein